MEKSGANPRPAAGSIHHTMEEEHISGNYSALLTKHNRYASYGTFSLFIELKFFINEFKPRMCRYNTIIYASAGI